MRWPFLSLSLFALALLSCTVSQNEYWWEKPSDEWPQILLSNSIEFRDRPAVSGASAFLLYYNNDTVVCTARHVVEKPIGIVPSVPQDSVNTLLKQWSVFARATALFDTIPVSKLRNTNPAPADFLVLDIQTKNTQITALEPILDSVHENDIIYVLGCERSDKDCQQNVYISKVRWTVDKQIIVEPESKFNAAGFSGAPAINKQGKVVGVVTSVFNQDGEFYLYLESIQQVLPFLK